MNSAGQRFAGTLQVVLLGFLYLSVSARAADDRVAPVVAPQAVPFLPREVRLLDGPFKEAMDRDAAGLLSLDADRLLSWFRKEAGLPVKAANYGGWEARGVAGHSLGHYLSACARMYQDTGDRRFLERVNYIVDQLDECQRANGNGYLAAIPGGKKVFAEVARGDIRSAGFDLNGAWVPWYTLHKEFAGLIDAYRYCDNAKALQVAARLGDWTIATTKNLTDEQWQKMLACEHGGMNEALANLYALTGETRYLDLAKKFYHRAILDPLAAGRDDLPGKHANTQIPKIIGAARIYELTGEAKFGNIARNFFNIVLTNHTYVTGGNSLGEHFGPSGKLNDRLGANTTETCNTYNMLKLARKLFELEPQARYADYYERAVHNHILASQNPATGQVCYFLSLAQGGHKQFLGAEDFTCCNGTGMENHARYGDNIYYHSSDALWVNLFIASELNWAAHGLRVRQETDFPKTGQSTLRFTCAQPVKLTVHVRHPFWVTNGFAVKLNGRALDVDSAPQSYATITREWRDGDTLEVDMPLQLRTEAMPDNPERIALFDGPILLAGDLGAIGSETAVPVFVTGDQTVADWVKPVAGKPLTFRTTGVGRPADVELHPFYSTYADRYSVYWDVFTTAEWAAREKAYAAEQARLKALADRTVELFQPGEMQPERDHNVQGDKSGPGEFSGRKLRHAWDGGWFSFEVAVPTNGPADLIFTYWGGETGNRTFDVLVGGERIATTSLHEDQPGKFWDKTYPVPEQLTQGKARVTVKLSAHPGNYAGGLFGVRVVRRVPTEVKLTVAVDHPGARINPAMWGVFFEDINFGADGGLYAELVKNRAFEFPNAMMGWSELRAGGAQGKLEIRDADPFDAANVHYLRIASDGAAAFGVSNEGFRGMGVRAGEDYDFSVQARAVNGSPALGVELVSGAGQVLAYARIERLGATWQKLHATLQPKTTEAKARLNLVVEGQGTADVDMVSLFPVNTWKHRPGGLRADMVQMLADLKPGFVRFPGGCIVEGHTLANRYQWKNTIGPVEERKLIKNRWNDEFRHRLTPDYYQSFGLGFFEYFQLCEDIGAEPLPILNCGMACQFNSGELCPPDQLDQYIQDALDLIEFANGPATSEWGAKRAAMGHPAPFHMKLLGVGNEQWGPQYVERYTAFARVLKEKHPEISLVVAAGPSPADDRFKFLWSKWRELRPDIVDEHSYARPDWFFKAATRYDDYDRSGPKVFMGEYAAQSVNTGSPENRNTWECALSEAAFMTGLERNADVVRMASYAPLFANVDAWQWTPDLIWVNNLHVYGTPNYYVQQLFSRNRGDVVLPVTLDAPELQDGDVPQLFASAAYDTATREVIVKVVNASARTVAGTLDLAGQTRVTGPAQAVLLTAAHLTDENSFAQPQAVAPKLSTFTISSPQFTHAFPPISVTVLRVKTK